MISAIILRAYTNWLEGKKGKELGCGTIFFMSLLILALCFGIFCFSWWIGMLLWNGCLVAAVPVLTKVSFWQFAGIDIVCGILFRGGSSSSKSKD